MKQQACSDTDNEESSSDNGSNCNVDDSFLLGVTFDRDDDKSDGEDEINVMGSGWKWNRLQDIRPDVKMPGPAAVDPYNESHGIRPGVTHSFKTKCSAINEELFKWLTANSNKCTHAHRLNIIQASSLVTSGTTLSWSH
eukprot:6407751-Ditylum_brightwellii.AAC.1